MKPTGLDRLTPEQRTEYMQLMEAAAMERARKSMLGFTLFTKPDYRINWHHRRLCEKLDAFAHGDIRFLMVFMPPRNGKSELVSRRLPAFLHGLYPDAEIMAASYLDSLAGDMTIDVQKIIDSPEYQQLFPNTKIHPSGVRHTIATRNSNEHHIIGHKGKYRGQGVGGSYTGKGANFILIDDPIKGREIADSEAFRERLWGFWLNDLYTRLETNLETGRAGQVLITQTRWHEDDLSGRLLNHMQTDANAIQWEIVEYPALRVDMDDPSDPRQVGEALWPEKYSVEELLSIRGSVGERAWGSLYQQNPMPVGGALFKQEMFCYGKMPDKFDYTFIMADTAYNDKKENDFTVFTAFGVKDNELYIHDVWRAQIKSADIELPATTFIKRHQVYGFRGAYIEPKGHGIYLNQILPRKGCMIPGETALKEFYTDRNKDKVERANNAVPWLGARRVTISDAIPMKEELLIEALGFPRAKHDDFVDTLIDGVKYVFARKPSLCDVL